MSEVHNTQVLISFIIYFLLFFRHPGALSSMGATSRMGAISRMITVAYLSLEARWNRTGCHVAFAISIPPAKASEEYLVVDLHSSLSSSALPTQTTRAHISSV